MPLLRNYKVVHNRELISKLGWQLQQTHLRQLRKRGRRVCPIYQLISFSDHQKYGLHIKKRKIRTCIDMGPQNLRSFKQQHNQDFIEAVSIPGNVLNNATNCTAWEDNWDMRMWNSARSSNCEPTFGVACLR